MPASREGLLEDAALAVGLDGRAGLATRRRRRSSVRAGRASAATHLVRGRSSRGRSARRRRCAQMTSGASDEPPMPREHDVVDALGRAARRAARRSRRPAAARRATASTQPSRLAASASASGPHSVGVLRGDPAGDEVRDELRAASSSYRRPGRGRRDVDARSSLRRPAVERQLRLHGRRAARSSETIELLDALVLEQLRRRRRRRCRAPSSASSTSAASA